MAMGRSGSIARIAATVRRMSAAWFSRVNPSQPDGRRLVDEVERQLGSRDAEVAAGEALPEEDEAVLGDLVDPQPVAFELDAGDAVARRAVKVQREVDTARPGRRPGSRRATRRRSRPGAGTRTRSSIRDSRSGRAGSRTRCAAMKSRARSSVGRGRSPRSTSIHWTLNPVRADGSIALSWQAAPAAAFAVTHGTGKKSHFGCELLG